MKISLISGSHRQGSQSQRISEILINLFTKSNIKNKVRFHKILINYIGTRFIDNILSIIDEVRFLYCTVNRVHLLNSRNA